MNRIIAVVAAVLILAGAGYFFFMAGPGGGDRISGEELRVYVEQELTESGATFEAVTYDEGSDTVTITKLDAPDSMPFYKNVKASRIEIKGGDKRALQIMFDDAAAKNAEGGDFKRVYKKMHAEGLTFELDNDELIQMGRKCAGDETSSDVDAEVEKVLGGMKFSGSMESVSLEDYWFKPTGQSLPAMLKFPETCTDEARKAFMAQMAELGQSLRQGKNEVIGVGYVMTMDGVSVDAKLESMKVAKFENGRMDDLEMGPMIITVSGEEVQQEMGGVLTASVQGVRMEWMDVSRMLNAMKEGTMIPAEPENAPILNDWTPTFGDYQAKDIKVSVPGLGDFTIEELWAEDVKHVAGLALGGKGGIKNLVIPVAAFGDSGAKPIMDALGAEELRVNVDSSSTFDEKEHVWDVSKFVIDVEKFGSLNTQFRFGGMAFLNDLVGLPSNEFVSKGMMNRILQEMTFARLKLTYQDHGFVDHMLNNMAQQGGMEREQLVQQYVQQFDAMRAQFGEIPAMDELSKALSTFLKEPKSLTLTFEPEEPVPLGQLSAVGMAAPAQLVETLGFSAEANK